MKEKGRKSGNGEEEKMKKKERGEGEEICEYPDNDEKDIVDEYVVCHFNDNVDESGGSSSGGCDGGAVVIILVLVIMMVVVMMTTTITYRANMREDTPIFTSDLFL